MYGCKSWTVKKAERWRIDGFELWCWRRLLRVPWTARRSKQSILKEISPGCSLEGLILKLKLQYFGHLMWRVDSLERLWCWEGLGAGGKGDNRGWDGWMASPTQWTWVWVNSWSWWWTGRRGVLQFMGSQRVGHDWETDLNWRHSINDLAPRTVSSLMDSCGCSALSLCFTSIYSGQYSVPLWWRQTLFLPICTLFLCTLCDSEFLNWKQISH